MTHLRHRADRSGSWPMTNFSLHKVFESCRCPVLGLRSASVSTCSRFLRQEGVGGADVTKNRPREDCCLDVYGPTSESLSWLSVTLCYPVSCAQFVALCSKPSVSLLECEIA